MAVWTNPLDYIVGQSASADYGKIQLQILDNLDFSGSHKHSGSAGDGSQLSPSQLRGSNAQLCVHRFLPLPLFMPISKTAANSNVAVANRVMGGYHLLANELGASSNYLIDIDKGSWSMHIVWGTISNGGIISACLDGTLIGGFSTYDTVEDYIESNAFNFTVSASGTHTLKFTSTGKAASSTGYFGRLLLARLMWTSY